MKKLFLGLVLLIGITFLGPHTNAYAEPHPTGWKTGKVVEFCQADDGSYEATLIKMDVNGSIMTFVVQSTHELHTYVNNSNGYSTALAAFMADKTISVFATGDGGNAYCDDEDTVTGTFVKYIKMVR